MNLNDTIQNISLTKESSKNYSATKSSSLNNPTQTRES